MAAKRKKRIIEVPETHKKCYQCKWFYMSWLYSSETGATLCAHCTKDKASRKMKLPRWSNFEKIPKEHIDTLILDAGLIKIDGGYTLAEQQTGIVGIE